MIELSSLVKTYPASGQRGGRPGRRGARRDDAAAPGEPEAQEELRARQDRTAGARARRGAPQGVGEVRALDDVSISVPAGDVVGVVGPSGSGKSTLARCVNLLERPTSGRVVVDGEDLTAMGPAGLRAARRRIGMVFQHFDLLGSRTALGNVALPLELAGVDRRERERRAAELLDRVGLAEKAGARPSQLSGGQQQRVAIARALAARPSVLLCDEATSALDPASTAGVLALVRELRDELGLTVVVVTHEMDVVRSACDSAVLLERGRVVDEGRLSEVADRPGSPLASRLLPPPPPAPLREGSALLQLVVTGGTEEPVLSALVREHGLDVAVVGGRVEHLGGRRSGHLQLEVLGGAAERAPRLRAATAALRERGVLVESAP
ncbi:methionine ABC transporter ATP-binding protein [uncultured Pseudokineococcus sp.]|uniref:methionine ABC transporter ATP-binding protein n=1 Tax=uncultured Pseudokineococcus sp. TaxID=1642928 RepID=UPI002632A875|nr:ATP-binding cassette domain-containing protein [uncultured Pseudokineococcus sp.]